jgi:UDP-glucose:(heptosyl)LPS alpha-1,3-glucosyltransferase
VRIAFVVHDFNHTGGHSRYVAEHVARMSAVHEVHVFANRFDGPIPAGVAAHRVPALRATALTTILSFAPAATLAARSRFDIIHAQGFSIGRPDVITAHISNARWLAARRGLEGSGLPAHERLFGAVVTPLERRALVDPRVSVIAVSKALADDITLGYGRSGPVHVIHHGVDATQFNPAVRHRHRAVVRRELGLDGDAVAFLYVGDLRKGFGPSLRALAKVPGAHLIAVSRSDLAAASDDAAAAGVRDRVHLVSPTGAVERYYGAADAFVLPTPYDAFGMVITEAMACGLPVITTPHAGASELVSPDVHGYLVSESGDVAALAAAMRRLAESAETRARLGEAAAALMAAHSWDAVVRRTSDVYAEHLDRRRRS